jgi:hypothetical protein
VILNFLLYFIIQPQFFAQHLLIGNKFCATVALAFKLKFHAKGPTFFGDILRACGSYILLPKFEVYCDIIRLFVLKISKRLPGSMPSTSAAV